MNVAIQPSQQQAAKTKVLSSIKQILPPLLIALAQQAHQMPAGMQTERTRLAGQLEPRLFRRAAAFSVIAGMTAGDEVFPSRFAGA